MIALSRVRHRNLVALRGYCEDEDLHCLLVMDLASGGSLEAALHGGRREYFQTLQLEHTNSKKYSKLRLAFLSGLTIHFFDHFRSSRDCLNGHVGRPKFPSGCTTQTSSRSYIGVLVITFNYFTGMFKHDINMLFFQVKINKLDPMLFEVVLASPFSSL